MIQVSASTVDDSVTVSLDGQTQRYTQTEWNMLWPTVLDELLSGKQVTLPSPALSISPPPHS